ncbi:MAG: hypothetical protein QW196_03930 [Sulfolobales archaeon]
MVSTCPKCGLPGYRYLRKEGERVYVYFSHYDPATRKRRKCYVGPIDSYEYVEKQHELGLAGLETTDYYEVAVEAIKKYIERVWREAEKNSEVLHEARKKLREMAEMLFKEALAMIR